MGPKYNPRRRKTFRTEHWNAVLSCTATAGESLSIPGLADWCKSHKLAAAPAKADQDLLDGALCALIGYIWLTQPRSLSLMPGDLVSSYMITPAVGEREAGWKQRRKLRRSLE